MSQNVVLLETGTNELEIVEFTIGETRFGINVIKVREIINPVHVTNLPNSHPNVEGIVGIRGEIMPVIDLAKVLGQGPSENVKLDKFVITEFNKHKFIFHVHTVTQIYRISWKDIEKPSSVYPGTENSIIGVVEIKDNLVLLLDFEKIMVDIDNKLGINPDGLHALESREREPTKTIVIAEDSLFLQNLIRKTLNEAGYRNLLFFENGLEALEFLIGKSSNGKKIDNSVQLVITDIEMRQMDGHHFTKQIRENEGLKHLPVIIFSSLITDNLRHKGEMVGATAQVSKPEIVELVGLIDKHVL
ncbi:chemotaxis protein [Ferdinandcohnia sp. SAFN-114]|uniref:chemotaxis protein n=1 Tax=Ferdinandcohnia sp. SAFN-114 TaxID=3387275 RepID=UPI003F7D3C9B